MAASEPPAAEGLGLPSFLGIALGDSTTSSTSASFSSPSISSSSLALMLHPQVLRKIFETWDELNAGAAEALESLRNCFLQNTSSGTGAQLDVSRDVGSENRASSAWERSKKEILANFRFSSKSLKDCLHVADLIVLVASAAMPSPSSQNSSSPTEPSTSTSSSDHSFKPQMASPISPISNPSSTSSHSPSDLASDIAAVMEDFVRLEDAIRSYVTEPSLAVASSNKDQHAEDILSTPAHGKGIPIVDPNQATILQVIAVTEDALRDLADGVMPWMDVLTSLSLDSFGQNDQSAGLGATATLGIRILDHLCAAVIRSCSPPSISATTPHPDFHTATNTVHFDTPTTPTTPITPTSFGPVVTAMVKGAPTSNGGSALGPLKAVTDLLVASEGFFHGLYGNASEIASPLSKVDENVSGNGRNRRESTSAPMELAKVATDNITANAVSFSLMWFRMEKTLATLSNPSTLSTPQTPLGATSSHYSMLPTSPSTPTLRMPSLHKAPTVITARTSSRAIASMIPHPSTPTTSHSLPPRNILGQMVHELDSLRTQLKHSLAMLEMLLEDGVSVLEAKGVSGRLPEDVSSDAALAAALAAEYGDMERRGSGRRASRLAGSGPALQRKKMKRSLVPGVSGLLISTSGNDLKFKVAPTKATVSPLLPKTETVDGITLIPPEAPGITALVPPLSVLPLSPPSLPVVAGEDSSDSKSGTKKRIVIHRKGTKDAPPPRSTSLVALEEKHRTAIVPDAVKGENGGAEVVLTSSPPSVPTSINPLGSSSPELLPLESAKPSPIRPPKELPTPPITPPTMSSPAFFQNTPTTPVQTLPSFPQALRFFQHRTATSATTTTSLFRSFGSATSSNVSPLYEATSEQRGRSGIMPMTTSSPKAVSPESIAPVALLRIDGDHTRGLNRRRSRSMESLKALREAAEVAEMRGIVEIVPPVPKIPDDYILADNEAIKKPEELANNSTAEPNVETVPLQSRRMELLQRGSSGRSTLSPTAELNRGGSGRSVNSLGLGWHSGVRRRRNSEESVLSIVAFQEWQGLQEFDGAEEGEDAGEEESDEVKQLRERWKAEVVATLMGDEEEEDKETESGESVTNTSSSEPPRPSILLSLPPVPRILSHNVPVATTASLLSASTSSPLHPFTSPHQALTGHHAAMKLYARAIVRSLTETMASTVLDNQAFPSAEGRAEGRERAITNASSSIDAVQRLAASCRTFLEVWIAGSAASPQDAEMGHARLDEDLIIDVWRNAVEAALGFLVDCIKINAALQPVETASSAKAEKAKKVEKCFECLKALSNLLTLVREIVISATEMPAPATPSKSPSAIPKVEPAQTPGSVPRKSNENTLPALSATPMRRPRSESNGTMSSVASSASQMSQGVMRGLVGFVTNVADKSGATSSTSLSGASNVGGPPRKSFASERSGGASSTAVSLTPTAMRLPEDLAAYIAEQEEMDDFDIVYESPLSSIHVTRSTTGVNMPMTPSLSSISMSSSIGGLERDYSMMNIPTTDGKLVKYATMRKLVERLTHWRIVDPLFRHVFLYTMSIFTTPADLLNHLADRLHNITSSTSTLPQSLQQSFEIHIVSPVITATLNFIMAWKEFRAEELQTAESVSKLEDIVKRFLGPNRDKERDETASSVGGSATLDVEADIISRFLSVMELGHTFAKKVPSEVAPWENPPSAVSPALPRLKIPTALSPLATGTSKPDVTTLIGIDSLLLARQMTLIDFNIYRTIRPHECLGQAYSKPGTRMVVAPAVVAMIERFNFVARLVTTLVMGSGTPRSRAELLGHFIAVAKRCLDMRNFNAAHAITSALTSASLHRLRRTWEKVPKRSTAVLKDLRALFAPASNWAELRAAIAAVPPKTPAVPWIGLYLRDLVVIEEAQTIFTDVIHGSETEPMVNFVRCRNIARVLVEPLRFQKLDGYPYKPDPIIQSALMDEDGILRSPTRQFEVSLAVEPRDGGEHGTATILESFWTGPTGLMLAMELARHGVISGRIAVVEKMPQPIKLSRAIIMHVRTIELLSRHPGLLERLGEQGLFPDEMVAHVNGNKAGSVDFKLLESTNNRPLLLSQYDTERIMEKYAMETYHIVCYRGWRAQSFETTDDHVIANFESIDGKHQTITAQYLVGADGGHSTVRKFTKASFEGHRIESTLIYNMDIHLKVQNPEKKLAPMSLFLSKNGLAAMIRCDGKDKDRYRIILPEPYDVKKLEEMMTEKEKKSMDPNYHWVSFDETNALKLNLEDMEREVNKRVPGFDIKLYDPLWTTPIAVQERKVNQYVFLNERVFLAGDAAHIHSPAGGQGMNTGIQDAINLAWKLAMVLQNQASNKTALLQSYNQEREPVAALVLKSTTMATDRIGFTSSIPSFIWSILGNIVIPTIVSFEYVQKEIAESAGELNISYRSKPSVAVETKHCLSGCRSFDGPIVLVGKEMVATSLYEAVVSKTRGHFVMVFVDNTVDMKDGAALAKVVEPLAMALQVFSTVSSLVLVGRPSTNLGVATEISEINNVHLHVHRAIDMEGKLFSQYRVGASGMFLSLFPTSVRTFVLVRPDAYIGIVANDIQELLSHLQNYAM
ncbi:hypothetical protein HDU97_009503 [Phlyctochytrium planicorne]|nr:hypothetical protein HDU97_009503 [Phlyctochytrium planicorne]